MTQYRLIVDEYDLKQNDHHARDRDEYEVFEQVSLGEYLMELFANASVEAIIRGATSWMVMRMAASCSTKSWRTMLNHECTAWQTRYVTILMMMMMMIKHSTIMMNLIDAAQNSALFVATITAQVLTRRSDRVELIVADRLVLRAITTAAATTTTHVLK